MFPAIFIQKLLSNISLKSSSSETINRKRKASASQVLSSFQTIVFTGNLKKISEKFSKRFLLIFLTFLLVCA
ncbi:hypothetical protein [Streptococcus pneumoniae]|uniref:hypothetical protein n=1 Tax=Streptococcus pneumoniae TaxID=1313 RepID=UPI00067D882D|nr:hypothetical protein [Streptococcus pneumoniae]